MNQPKPIKLLSDYDRVDLNSREQVAMATLRALGIRHTPSMKKLSKEIVAQLDKENDTIAFADIVKDLNLED